MAQQTFEELVDAVKQAESRGKRYKDDGKTLTTSSKGALGEMQVMPKTIRDPGFGVTPAKDKSPDEIARVGVDYLQAMKQKYGDTEKALIAYNWGPGSTDKWLASGADPKKLPAETRTYVERVKGFLGKDVPRETSVAKKEREPLPPSLPPMAQADIKIPSVKPEAAARVASLGPGYQAALALSFLAETDDEEDRKTTITQEYLAKAQEDEEEQAAAVAARTRQANVFADLSNTTIRSPFAEPQQPVRMKDGGDVGAFERLVPRRAERRLTPQQMESFVAEGSQSFEEPKAKNLMERFNQLISDNPALVRARPLSPLGVLLNAGYGTYQYVTGKDPLRDLDKAAHESLYPETDTGSETISEPISVGLPPIRRANGSPEEGERLTPQQIERIAAQGPTERKDEPFFDAAPRTYVDVLTGRREPITAKDFTAKEQMAMMDAVRRSQARGGKGRVDYEDYPDSNTVGPGYVDIRNTLGGFQYKQGLDGSTIITDKYDFHGPRVAEYEKMGSGEKLVKSAKNALMEFVGKGLSPRDLAGELGRAYVGSKGPDVNIRIPVGRAEGSPKEGERKLDRETMDMLRRQGTSPASLQRVAPPADISSSAAGLPGLMLLADPRIDNTNAYGYMLDGGDDTKNRAMAQAMFLNKSRSEDYPDTIAHETEHLLARQNLGSAANINSKFDELIGNKGTSRLNFVRDAVKAAPYLKEKYDLQSSYLDPKMFEYQSKFGLGKNLLYEQLASLAALEQRHKIDLTKDPELRKTLFSRPDVRETYNALTGLRQTRLDPRDLPPHTRVPEPGMLDAIKGVFKRADGGPVYRADGSPEEGEMSDKGSITVQEAEVAKAIFPSLPVTEAVYLLRGSQRQSTPQGEMLSGNMGARIPLGKDAEAMLMLAGSRPEGRQDSSKALLAMLNQRMGEGSVGAQMVRPMDAPAGTYAGGVSGSYPVGEGRVMGNVNMMRMPGQDPRVTDYGVGYGGKVGPGELSAMIMRQKDGPYSGQIQYRLPIGRAEGSPEEGEVAPRLTMQQIEALAAREAAEREAASNAAFIAQKSGIGRKAGPVSQALQSGQGYIEAAKGFTMLPQNLVGGAFDISNMIANVYGGGVEKPIFGSENLKEQSRKAGIAFKPSDDPTLAAFFGAGDLGSNLVNPAGVTRAGVKAAEKTGEAVKGTASDLLAKYQATQAPKPKMMTDLMTGQQFEVGGEDYIRQQFANIAAQRRANATNVLGEMPRMQTPQTEPPIPVGWGEVDVTPGEVLDAQQALRAQRAEREAQQAAQNAQQQPQQLALPLEAPVEPPVAITAPAPAPKVTSVAPPVTIKSTVTPSNPFVGRLDNFVATLKGPVTKDQLLGQLRGKFRDYDLNRVEQALEDLKPTDKIKPADLKQRLDNMFSPRDFRLGIVEPNPQAAGIHNLGMDNPFIDDKTKQMGVINLLMETPKEKLLVHRETSDAYAAFERFKGFTNTPEQIQLLKDFFVKTSPEKATTLTADLDALTPYVNKIKEKRAILGEVVNAVELPILSKKWTRIQYEMAQQYPDVYADFDKYKPLIDEAVIKEGLKDIQQNFGLTPPPFSLYKQDPNAFKEATKKTLTPLNNELTTAENDVKQAMAPIGKEIESLIQGRRLYRGQHSNLNEPYNQNNPVAFSRFTDHEALIGDQGTKSGMYVHELQSDRFDDLIKKGPKGGSPEKDKKELIALNIQVRDKVNMPIYDGTPKGGEKYGAEIGPASDRLNIFNRAADAVSISYDKIGSTKKIKELFAAYPNEKELIKDAIKIAQRQRVLSSSQRIGSQAHQLEESFAGMETSPQVVQQLLAKNAIVAAMQRGKEFVAFPGKESSQSQLYEKLPANLKQVVKDLGSGFEIRPIELPVGDVDALNTLGVTWSPEAAARILKTGVPFNKGGMVERQPTDNRRYL